MFHETDYTGSKSGKGSWTGMMGLVSSGVADIGVTLLVVSKERSEVVAFTDALKSLR